MRKMANNKPNPVDRESEGAIALTIACLIVGAVVFWFSGSDIYEKSEYYETGWIFKQPHHRTIEVRMLTMSKVLWAALCGLLATFGYILAGVAITGFGNVLLNWAYLYNGEDDNIELMTPNDAMFVTSIWPIYAPVELAYIAYLFWFGTIKRLF